MCMFMHSGINGNWHFSGLSPKRCWWKAIFREEWWTYLAVRTSMVPFSFSSPSFSKYISLDCRRTNQRFFQFLLESVDDPPPFLWSQPCLSASCLERNHKKVSSFRTHQRLFHVFIKPPGTKDRDHLAVKLKTNTNQRIKENRGWINAGVGKVLTNHQNKKMVAFLLINYKPEGFVFMHSLMPLQNSLSSVKRPEYKWESVLL